jgi:addiction module HigA family antidote
VSTLNNTTEAPGRGPRGAPELAMPEYKAGKRLVAPTHPGSVVASTLADLRVSARKAATMIGVNTMTLTNVMNGHSAVSPDMALRLGKLFGNGPEIWLAMQAQYDLWVASQRLAPAIAAIETLEAS